MVSLFIFVLLDHVLTHVIKAKEFARRVQIPQQINSWHYCFVISLTHSMDISNMTQREWESLRLLLLVHRTAHNYGSISIVLLSTEI